MDMTGTKSAEEKRRSGQHKPFPCGLCGEDGHNVMHCPLTELALSMVLEWKKQVANATQEPKNQW